MRINAEIFDPYIQDLKESTSKAIEKVNTKLTKDNSDLKFDGHSLKNAKVSKLVIGEDLSYNISVESNMALLFYVYRF